MLRLWKLLFSMVAVVVAVEMLPVGVWCNAAPKGKDRIVGVGASVYDAEASEIVGVEKKRKLRLAVKQRKLLQCDMCLRVVDFVIKAIDDTQDNFKYRRARGRMSKAQQLLEFRRSEERMTDIMWDASDFIKEGFLLHPMNYSRLSNMSSAFLHLDSASASNRLEAMDFKRITRRAIAEVYDTTIEWFSNDISKVFHRGTEDDEYHSHLCGGVMEVCPGGFMGVFTHRKLLLKHDKEDRDALMSVPDNLLASLKQGIPVVRTKRKEESGILLEDSQVAKAEVEARHVAAERGEEYVEDMEAQEAATAAALLRQAQKEEL